LLEDDQVGTDRLATGEIGWVGTEEESSEHLAQQGSGPLGVRLHIGESGREVVALLTKAVHLGRLEPASDIFPEIDLSEDGGSGKGVSRRHARILKREGTVMIEDLGSINGTFVNGRRLAPYQAEALHDGDQLQLGKLLIEIEFS
jgi:pSer/pThr/pTyr-binding forkhead associated (FHA) protein